MYKKNFYDYTVILSHLMDSNAQLNKESKLRADEAVKLFRNNCKAKIITCGWDYRKDNKKTIAQAIAEYLIKKYKLSKSFIFQEEKSKDTVGHAIFTRKFFIKNINKKIAIITSDYHVKRTKMIFEFVFGKNFMIEVFSCDSNSSKEVKLKEIVLLINSKKLL